MKTLHEFKPVMNAAVALSIMCFGFTSDMITLLCCALNVAITTALMHGWRNRFGRPGDRRTNVCYMVPGKASRCDLRSRKFQKFSVLHMDNQLLGRRASLIAGLKHMKQTMEFMCKANGATLSICCGFFCPFPLCQTSQKSFSDFSVGFCINEEKGYLLPTQARKITLPTFRLNAPVIIRAKVKEVRTNITIYSHTLLKIQVIGGLRSVRIAPPFLPPHHSDPAARDFQSSFPVEVLLLGCHLDVQGLLQQQFLSSAVVKYCGLLPVDRMVILPRMFRYS